MDRTTYESPFALGETAIGFLGILGPQNLCISTLISKFSGLY
jgi:hypothetical protein